MSDKTQKPTVPTAPAASSKQRSRRRIGFVIIWGVLTILFHFGLRYLITAFTHETTDDAFIETGVVLVSPRVAGLVSAVHVRDNQWVNAGDPLVDVDPRDYETTLAQKRAGLSVTESNQKSTEAVYQLMKARLTTAEAVASQSDSEAAAAQANSDKADADLKRADSLRGQNVLSKQEYDQIRATEIAAAATAAADREKAKSDQSKVAEARAQLQAVVASLEMVTAQIAQAQAEVKSATLDLSYTHIVSPTNGVITRKAVHVGEYVQVGQRLLAVVPTNIWVTANFKETQLDHLRPHMPVEIHVDAYPELALPGHVDSIQSGSGARFSMLPPENAVGNYVKVVQRVPVNIYFDVLPGSAFTLGPGMSVTPSVRTSDFKLPAIVLGLAAVVLALLATALGMKALPDRGQKDTPTAS